MILPTQDFCLIRHGETEANRDGLIAGRAESRLTPAGLAAAKALARHPWPAAIAVFTSPQERARTTAALAFPGQPAQVVPDLRERDWGRFELCPLAEQPPRTATPEGGEGWEPLLTRIAGALSLCMDQAQAVLPVIVAHSGVIRAARALTGGDFTGPSAPNTTPLLFRAPCAGSGGSWQEHPLFAERSLP
ncbi:histidine phosphatase family protein [Pseudotabrizicola sp. 4114]|uniref:histidine phosphatase family protein n=1 Tax=Pseudotabrizicola sp. 4114 TaxID=2817731 RepID=UPI002858912F|nr:putative phosphoglycerate mutase [Pseudorhodobacter sp. 4114]